MTAQILIVNVLLHSPTVSSSKTLCNTMLNVVNVDYSRWIIMLKKVSPHAVIWYWCNIMDASTFNLKQYGSKYLKIRNKLWFTSIKNAVYYIYFHFILNKSIFSTINILMIIAKEGASLLYMGILLFFLY